MAIYGVGAYWDDKYDKVGDFLQEECACIGWSRADAPTLYQIADAIKLGSIIYLKSHNPQSGLRIKAIGIATELHARTSLSQDSIRVRWIWTGEDLVGQVNDKYPVRACRIGNRNVVLSNGPNRTGNYSEGLRNPRRERRLIGL